MTQSLCHAFLSFMTNIVSGSSIAEIAALIGDTARANILSELMGVQALTAGELAQMAGVSTQTTSGHLVKLQDARLITLERRKHPAKAAGQAA